MIMNLYMCLHIVLKTYCYVAGRLMCLSFTNWQLGFWLEWKTGLYYNHQSACNTSTGGLQRRTHTEIFLQSQSLCQGPGTLSQDQERRNRIESAESNPRAIKNVADIAGTHVAWIFPLFSFIKNNTICVQDASFSSQKCMQWWQTEIYQSEFITSLKIVAIK